MSYKKLVELYKDNNKFLLSRLILLQNNYNMLIFYYIIEVFKNYKYFLNIIYFYLKIFKYNRKNIEQNLTLLNNI